MNKIDTSDKSATADKSTTADKSATADTPDIDKAVSEITSDNETSDSSNPDIAGSDAQTGNAEEPSGRPDKKKMHLIRPAWIRIPLKIICCILLVVALIPVLLYIPPVQTFIKNIACNVVKDKTGMDIRIGKFRLK